MDKLFEEMLAELEEPKDEKDKPGEPVEGDALSKTLDSMVLQRNGAGELELRSDDIEGKRWTFLKIRKDGIYLASHVGIELGIAVDIRGRIVIAGSY